MVDVSLIKKLRAMTHAPLKDCKSAIEESNGDLDRAQEILREKWALKAAKKTDRDTNEWIVIIDQIDWKTIGIKLGCETDFVAKNDIFVSLAHQIIAQFSALDAGLSSYDEFSDEVKQEAEQILKDNFVTIGENMKILDAFVLDWTAYVYRHPWDKVASAVFYQGDESKAKDVALQVAAMNAEYLSVDEVPEDLKSQLKAEYIEEMKDSWKPSDIVEKIVEGKLQKYFRDIVLLEQASIMDDSKSVKQHLGDTAVSKYIRFAI